MGKPFILFGFRENIYATGFDAVEEIVGVENVVNTNVDGLKAMVHKGEITPVVDPQAIIYINGAKLTSKSKVIITKKNDEFFGFLVDEVIGIEMAREEEIEKPRLSDENFVRARLKDVKVIRMGDFILEEIMEKSDELRKNELDVVVDAEKSIDFIIEEEKLLKEEVNKDLINLLVDKKNKLNDSQVEKIISIHKKIEGF